ncbi:MAG: hypothetical protein NT051_01830 [Candidatus Micrarchaeota archaeon]|nr:hypothetical protein [Candidatus Micrarchaeota archaeon]
MKVTSACSINTLDAFFFRSLLGEKTILKNARILIQSGEYQANKYSPSPSALRRLSAAIDLLEGQLLSDEIGKLLAEAYYQRGRANFLLNNNKRALSDLGKAISLCYGTAAYLCRSEVHSELGNYKGAIDDLTKAIGLNPASAELFVARGLVKYGSGDYQGAIDDCNMAICRNPDSNDAYHVRGNAKAKLNDMEGANEDYRIAAEIYKRQTPDAQVGRAVGNGYKV